MAKLTPLSFAALLMISSALVSPAAFAQEAPATQNPGGADTPINESAQEEIEISGPGAGGSNEIVVRGRFIPNPIRATAEVLSVLSEADIAAHLRFVPEKPTANTCLDLRRFQDAQCTFSFGPYGFGRSSGGDRLRCR